MASKPRPSQKRTLLAIFGPFCYLCRRAFAEDELTFDHIMPLSKGGKSNLGNLRLACDECNQRKGNQVLTEPNQYAGIKIVVEN